MYELYNYTVRSSYDNVHVSADCDTDMLVRCMKIRTSIARFVNFSDHNIFAFNISGLRS